jgi:hypothetical protein
MAFERFRRALFGWVNHLGSRTSAFTAAIAAGDAARDQRDWATAAQSYHTAISIDSSRADIWVQLGHALKEGGNCAGGEDAYRRAWSLKPDTADTAMQLGHVLKLQGQLEEATRWYKTSMALGCNQREPVRELLALGVDRAELTTELLQEKMPRASPGASAIFWDATATLSEHESKRLGETSACWLLELIAAAGRAGLSAQLVCRDAEQFVILPKSSQCSLLMATASLPLARMTGTEGVHTQVGLLLLVDPKPEDPFTLARQLQSAAVDLGFCVVLMLPTVMPLSRPEWFAPDEVAECRARLRALLPVVPQVFVACDEDALLLRGLCRGEGITPPLFGILDFQPHGRPRGRAKVTTDHRSVWTVLQPRDKGEQRQLLAAWRQIGNRPATLILVPPARSSVPAQAEMLATFACEGTVVSLLSSSQDAIGDLLAASQHLLVPASREDSDSWIGFALRAGAPVMAAASRLVFAKWGSAIRDYIDWRDETVLARRWASSVATGAGDLETLLEGWGTAFAIASRSAKLAIPVSIPRLGIGVFQFLGDPPASAEANALVDGKRARCGVGWGRILPEGAELQDGPAMLRFLLEDLVDETLRYKFLVRNIGDKPVDVTIAVDVSSVQTVPVPARGWLWIDQCSANPAVGSALGEVRVTLGAASGIDARPLVVGFFIFPADADRYWFEFMDQVSQGRFPLLHWITSERRMWGSL